MSNVDVYPVGALRDLRMMWSAVRHGHRIGWMPAAGEVRRYARWMARSWRRRSYWNGYLAEPTWGVDGPAFTRCGHGWTERRARRSLAAHVLELADQGGHR